MEQWLDVVEGRQARRRAAGEVLRPATAVPASRPTAQAAVHTTALVAAILGDGAHRRWRGRGPA